MRDFISRTLLAGVAIVGLMAGSAHASFVTWDSRVHSGDITADTPPHAHDAAGYVAAFNALPSSGQPAGYGVSGFDDWTGKNNQNTVPSGSNGTYGLHAYFTFNVPAAEVGSWTFNIGNDADFGGVFLIDGTQLAISPGGYYPNGPSGSRVLTAGLHTADLYSFEQCCDGAASSTFSTPLRAGPLAINNVNLSSTPEPTSIALIGVAGLGLLARRRRA
jgi:hypothetical protein